ncbi:3-ketoacyl-ACP reductase [Paenibacillus baekrokdamisoli]|uniref:3-ketoacyl-ACP reductase n=1 Tax=Paenibacillus baekrokdamisoli TaxID=1712516 RepID=A0A3G9IPM8_9BACL|nr:glucose 1-dehydrogenase [Paenibacillus baekrokdamisoli]MBB3072014.1 NAD(P)-dependent dehydrogenase (short-subunit alcohol dehydrogenase family) [Paenibacillus baekrokdamisoli]BBH20316.1 3-ketoacyl-ACP reductase [Paenibacillus baekrokdamisoli]
MSDRLTGKVVLVTGGSRGIGSGICKELALAGASVALNYTSNDVEARKVAEEIQSLGGKVRIYQADVSNKQQVDEMVASVIMDFGTIDSLVNNAGICPFRSFFDITEEIWNKTIEVNLSGMFFCAQAAGRHMRDQGKGTIINIGTVTSMRGGSQQVHYASSKGGVNAFTISLSNELRTYGIRVNAILCGGVPTDINKEQFASNKQTMPNPATQRGIRDLGTPEDLGKAVVYLASDDSEWVTGSLMAVDGGALVRNA